MTIERVANRPRYFYTIGLGLDLLSMAIHKHSTDVCKLSVVFSILTCPFWRPRPRLYLSPPLGLPCSPAPSPHTTNRPSLFWVDQNAALLSQDNSTWGRNDVHFNFVPAKSLPWTIRQGTSHNKMPRVCDVKVVVFGERIWKYNPVKIDEIWEFEMRQIHTVFSGARLFWSYKRWVRD